MTAPSENYDDSSKSLALSATVVASLGIAGLVVGIGGYLSVMLLSIHSGWWSMQYILTLAVCGSLAALLGIMTVTRSGQIRKLKVLARVLGVMSIVVGILILGIITTMLALMLILANFSK